MTREKISELLRWAGMSFFRGLWKSSSKHKSEFEFDYRGERERGGGEEKSRENRVGCSFGRSICSRRSINGAFFATFDF